MGLMSAGRKLLIVALFFSVAEQTHGAEGTDVDHRRRRSQAMYDDGLLFLLRIREELSVLGERRCAVRARSTELRAEFKIGFPTEMRA
jgi:hypothetical protein